MEALNFSGLSEMQAAQAGMNLLAVLIL